MSIEKIRGVVYEFAKSELERADQAHDMLHIGRVLHWAKQIGIDERQRGRDIDTVLVHCAVMLHEVGDRKIYPEGKDAAYAHMRTALSDHLSADFLDQVIDTIRYSSYSENIGVERELSLETKILQDADKLDSLGAMGVMRMAHYGGHHNRLIYDPEVPPRPDLTQEEYKSYITTTINHLDEKLLQLIDLLHTEKARQIAQPRHDFLLAFRDQFYAEMAFER